MANLRLYRALRPERPAKPEPHPVLLAVGAVLLVLALWLGTAAVLSLG